MHNKGFIRGSTRSMPISVENFKQNVDDLTEEYNRLINHVTNIVYGYKFMFTSET